MAPPPSTTATAAYAGGDRLTPTVPSRPQRLNPDHPPYAEMVQAALLSIADPRGSTDSSISRYIVSAYPGIPPGHPKLLPYYLRKLVASGELSVPSPGRYLLPTPNTRPPPPVPRPRLVIRLRRVPTAGDGSGANAVSWCHVSAGTPAKESAHPTQAEEEARATKQLESTATEVFPVLENLQVEHGLKLSALRGTRKDQPKESITQDGEYDKEPPPPVVPPITLSNGVVEQSSLPVSSGRKGQPRAPTYLHPKPHVVCALPAMRQSRRESITQEAEHDKEPPPPPVSANSLSKASVTPTVGQSVEAVGQSSLPFSSDRKGERLAPAYRYVVCALTARRQARSKSMKQDAVPDKEPPPSPPVAANLLSTTAVSPIVSRDLECEEHGPKLPTMDVVVEQSSLSFSSERKGEQDVECSLPTLRQDGSKESSPFSQTLSEFMAQDLDSHPLASEFDKEPPASTPIPKKLQSERDPKSPSLGLVLEKSSSPALDNKKGLSSTGRTPKARHRRLWYEQ